MKNKKVAMDQKYKNKQKKAKANVHLQMLNHKYHWTAFSKTAAYTVDTFQ